MALQVLFQSQISRQTVPDLGPSDCEVSCPKTSVCSSDSEASRHSRPDVSWWPLIHRYTINGQIWRHHSMQTLVDHHCHLVHDALMNCKPVEFKQDRSDVVILPGLCCNTICSILNSLKLLQQPRLYFVDKLMHEAAVISNADDR